MAIISFVVAMARNGVIGKDNQLPWRLPADLRHFKAVTMGKPIIMGRKTFDSIGRPLPGRTNIVVTRDSAYQAEGCLVAHSIEAALAAAGDVEEVMIIGGADFYRQLLPRADRIYLTLIDAEIEGDTRFPELDAARWRERSREQHAPDEQNPYPYSFIVLESARGQDDTL
ncbi:MAG: type 3 dihydrofolate reductase [Xanthomonadaceae bacterium]|nr:type 3 dihydrofolate reductase [Xanthomonadaceae bacterium]